MKKNKPIKKLIIIPKKKLKKNKVLVLAGDYKNRTYEVDRVLRNGYVYLKDLYGLNSKKKSYSKKVHSSNLKLI